ncbi:hypothetical protein SAMN05421833_14041 [Microbispora rosea]|uniref:Heavy-metal-associated domain-containing protein n=1 Tax=Microbispora rosea TaxID=58117 RepID=A0A1N7H9T1_9ACTN|nr:hypothetical protein [Microbispora rosea]GIH49871.1 hypothetical protein Mro03_50500 [Microbispora rosea subsp. rosea]SIS21533.1 hypothetical protein SAMN05421833_14041 [Microbispora rosea]
MNTPARLGTYVLGLAVVFAGAFGVGGAVGATGPAPAKNSHGDHTTPPPATQTTEHVPGGLQVSQNGYTLTPRTATITPGTQTDFRFTVDGPDGRPVTAYETQHDKKLHLIVVSRDGLVFRHLHPELSGEGIWSVPLTLPDAGAYRVFADFVPQGAEGLTLGADLHAPGDYAPRALPAPSRTATADGYTVRLDGTLTPGAAGRLTAEISKDGKPVTDLQPYLGAYGHLVALRVGDLAYLHVHPDGAPGDGVTPAGPGITFYAEVPSRGDYRLFLDFQHDGAVHTAAFTVRAEQPSGAAAPTATADHGSEHSHSGH